MRTPGTSSDRRTWLATAALGAAVWVGAAAGCRSLPPAFPIADSALVWPGPPMPARLRYAGQLRAGSDLGERQGLGRRLGDLLLGRKREPPLTTPRAVVCTSDGERVWVADPGAACLHLFSLSERKYRSVSNCGDQAYVSPVGLCLGADGELFVCDSTLATVAKLSAVDGTLLATLPLPAAVKRPVALAFHRERRELYVADAGAHDIKVFDREHRLCRTLGGRGREPGQLNFPCDVWIDGDSLWVVDAGNHRLQRLALDGTFLSAFGTEGDAPGCLALPKACAMDSAGHVYVTDARFENVQVFDREGRLLLFLGEEGTGPGEFWLPSGACIDSRDRLWVCDSYNRRLQVFQYLSEDVDETLP